MMELKVSKRKMLRLIRDCRHRMDEPIPIPAVKECKFKMGKDYYGKISWHNGSKTYRFVLTELDQTVFLTASIYDFGMLEQGFILPIGNDRMEALGILTEREEGLACQG